MEFKSLPFVLFLPVVVLLYYLTPQRFKWLVLLTSSFVFIAFNSVTSLLTLVVAILINFYSAQWINKIESPKKKQHSLWSIVAINLIVLGVFKYYNIFNHGIDYAMSNFNIEQPLPYLKWLLPLGVSYYIFQSIGYNIEVYRGNEQPEKHLGNFAVYLSFFPKLIAGPIERSFNFLPQLKEKISLKYENFSIGGRLILWGAFKKMVIAEHINEFIQPIFENSEAYSGIPLIIGLFLYTLEIYLDFSGYTDMALGCAHLFGFKLTQNFKQPFFATSLTDFWRRWHISLSTWVNDYVFTPLSMWVSITFNFKKWGIIFSVFFSFLLLGMWHGSNWTFAIFGAVQGLVLGYEILSQKMRKQLASSLPKTPYKLVSICLTLLVFTFSCVYFKASGIEEAHQWIIHSVQFQSNLALFNNQEFLVTAIGLILFIFIDHHVFKKGFETWCSSKASVIRWGIYIVMIYAILILSGVNTYPFIYSNF